jgi:hypothetical protein
MLGFVQGGRARLESGLGGEVLGQGGVDAAGIDFAGRARVLFV